jgi:uncharacterized protein YlxP (DUF503 family)
MFVGVLRLEFHLPRARSLKDKRQIVRSFRDRLRANLGVSVAEVEAQDLHQRAVFGVATVSADAAVCDEILAKAASMADVVRDAIVVARHTELVNLGAGRTSLGQGS